MTLYKFYYFLVGRILTILIVTRLIYEIGLQNVLKIIKSEMVYQWNGNKITNEIRKTIVL